MAADLSHFDNGPWLAEELGAPGSRRRAVFTLRQLRYFVAAADGLALTSAAKSLHVSQPSVSAAVMALEELFGTELFVRHHAKGLSLTPTGEKLAREARALLKHADDMQSVAGEMSSEIKGALSIGCLITIAPYLVPQLLQQFRERHPQAVLNAAVDHQEALLSALMHGRLDVLVTYDLDVPKELTFQPFASLPPYVVAAEKSRIAKMKRVNLADLVNEPLVLLDLPLSREYFLGIFSAAGITPHVRYRSAHAEVVRSMVAQGLGYSILNIPSRTHHALNGSKFVSRDLVGQHRSLALGTAARTTSHPRAILKAFQTVCADVMRDMVQQGL